MSTKISEKGFTEQELKEELKGNKILEKQRAKR